MRSLRGSRIFRDGAGMTDQELYQLHRKSELKLLREVARERDGGRHDRDHDSMRRVQTTAAAGESLVVAGADERLTHDQALEQLRRERARSVSRLRPRMSAKSR